MPKLNVAPTKSNLLSLKQQLEVAEEGFDLLEQKRQILIFELMSRLNQAREAERRVVEVLKEAFAVLRDATLDIGSNALERAALGVISNHEVVITERVLMGLRVPQVAVRDDKSNVHFGLSGTSTRTDQAMQKFQEMLPLLGELAELENAVLRLSRELRKTQRRCNALSKVFIPDCAQTIDYIVSSLEERERESFIILKMIKNRLSSSIGV